MRKNLKENFYTRLNQLAGVKSANNPSTSLSTSTLIEYSRATDGIALGIVKENHSYFIKKSNSKGDKLGAEDFAYISGVENKHKYQYPSLSEATKNKVFFLQSLNEASAKKFKTTATQTVAITEAENINKAQVNADGLNAGKAQSEADKSKSGGDLKDTAEEKKPGEVKSSKEIAVEKKEAPKPKVVDATKSSSAKAISTDKQIKPKVNAVAKVEKTTVIKEGKEKVEEYGDEHPVSVKDAVSGKKMEENFGNEEPSISSDEPVMPAGERGAVASAAPSDAAAGASGAAEPELDAAAAALDSMGAGATEMGGGENPGIEGMEGADGGVKDIEKYVGKATQKIRDTELTPEMALGFLKSFITAFQGKLTDLDHEDRKGLANLVLNDEPDAEGGEGEGTPSFGGDKEGGEESLPDTSTDNEEESEIEEAINQHLAEMGIGEDENVENHENIGAATKPFKKYVAERGYNPEKVEEISMMEMVGLMNSYTNECGEAPDAEGMSDYVTNEVHEKMNESGNSLFEDLMKPFGEKIKKNKKAYAAESVLPMNEMFGEEEPDAEGEESAEESEPSNSLSVGDEPAGEESGLDGGEVAPDAEVEKSITIAPAGDTLGVGTPMGNKVGGEGSKSATVDLNAATITLTMNEAEAKLRKIVQKKLADKIAGKKGKLNEHNESALSKMIDEAINEALTKRRAAIEARLLKGR